MRIGGIVLCGGRSSRMGLTKATLPFGPESMICRVLRVLSDVVDPLVVVGAPHQELPALPPGVLVARDQREGFGPLEGLCAGLQTLESRAEGAYATGCDVPLLVPSFVRHLIDLLSQHQVAVPVEGRFYHPLAAAYQTSVLPTAKSLLAANHLRPVDLYQHVDTCRVDLDQLRSVDPKLRSLANLNRPADYLAAVQQAGFTVPEAIRRQLAEFS